MLKHISRSVCVGLCWLALQGAASAQTANPASHFGVVDDFVLTNQTALDRAREAGIGWVSYIFYWNQLNPIEDVYDFNNTDAEIARIQQAGLNISGRIMFPPAWATGVSYPNYLVPYYCLIYPQHPDCNDNTKRPRAGTLDKFLRALIARYKDRIRYWSVGTEIHNRVFWQGSPVQFVNEVLVPGYQLIKSIDPGLTVTAPDEDVEDAIEYLFQLEQQYGRYCDVITWHVLNHSGGSLSRLDSKFKPLVDRYAAGRPVWLTELGMMSDTTVEPQQASWLGEMMQGVLQRPWIDKAFIYRLKHDQTTDFGILRADDSRKPSWYTSRDVIAANPATASAFFTISGAGRVGSSIGALFSGSHSVASTSLNNTVVLNLGPNSGWTFGGWSGDQDCLDGVLSMTNTRSCGAQFLSVVGNGAANALDFNGDGASDIFQYNPSNGDWSQEFSNRTGGFGRAIGSWSPGWTTYSGDFNGDGRADIFLYSETTGVWFKCFSNGQGGFTYFSGAWSPGWSIYVLDSNGDRLSDLFLYSRQTGSWFKCQSLPNGDFRYFAGQWGPGWSIFPMELNGDGRADLFLYSDSGGTWFRAVDDGAGEFGYYTESWSGGWQIIPADIDGNGKTDIFLWSPTTGVWFEVINDGSQFSYIQGSWSAGWNVYPADLDANGRVDFFLYNPSTGVWVKAFNTANGAFVYDAGSWSAGWTINVTDLNADRRADVLLYSSSSGQYFQCLNLATHEFSYSSGSWAAGLRLVSTRPVTP
ncbi:MAG: VCBS repeat-containing protein [Acidobacteria bacterium]|nr:VCBS repeat-containing protein [Acidobacteriota bacterium]MBI3264639.1 VCBS repeat-containing protein [Acidobacteriota bacterium]